MNGEKPRPKRTPEAEIQRRVGDIFEVVLAGARFKLIRQYMTDSCDWTVDDRTLARYVARAREDIRVISTYDRAHRLGEAIGRLDNIYARCVSTKDLRGALSAQRELNELLGLHAPRKLEHSGPQGEPLFASDVEAVRAHVLGLIDGAADRIEAARGNAAAADA